MSQGLVIIIGIVVIALLFAFIIHILGPISRKLLLSKSSISILISGVFIGLSFLYRFVLDLPESDSGGMTFLDMLFFIPVIIPYGIGYGGGSDFAFYFSIIVEIIILAFFIRFLITCGIQKNKRKNDKKTLHNSG